MSAGKKQSMMGGGSHGAPGTKVIYLGCTCWWHFLILMRILPPQAGETGSGLRCEDLKCKRGKFQLLSAVPVRHPAFKNGGGGLKKKTK